MKSILLIRHAEKPTDAEIGVDESGTQDNESLTVRGWQRAGALAVLFGVNHELGQPARIYASQHDDHGVTVAGHTGNKSQRPFQTVSPLAKLLKQSIIGKYSKRDEAKLVEEIKGLTGTTLVSWQHEAIPEIACAIAGDSATVPAAWPDNRFDVIWRLRQAEEGQPWTFDQICQNLLAGDQAQPIA